MAGKGPWFLVFALAAGACGCSHPPPAPARPRAATAPPSDPLEQKVRALVARLGDPAFSKREAAQKELVRMGAKALAVLDRIPAPDDLEVRARLALVRRRLARPALPKTYRGRSGVRVDYAARIRELRRQARAARARGDDDAAVRLEAMIFRIKSSLPVGDPAGQE